MKVEDDNRFTLQVVNNSFADFCNMDKEDMYRGRKSNAVVGYM
ncbi:hypothetical protein QTN47_21065 [Danxiaibacter flavus]|uniref:Uncharacterized protein n=1 Tax=Danxiaibacter flavus TaxID=3049108 RepID=A0ABV3ZJM2_9BACT|nr:hypothetical protein QNM32_21070 [Chitinophagaceae bacterium DXS]